MVPWKQSVCVVGYLDAIDPILSYGRNMDGNYEYPSEAKKRERISQAALGIHFQVLSNQGS
jgi:hypothetical protein